MSTAPRYLILLILFSINNVYAVPQVDGYYSSDVGQAGCLPDLTAACELHIQNHEAGDQVLCFAFTSDVPKCRFGTQAQCDIGGGAIPNTENLFTDCQVCPTGTTYNSQTDDCEAVPPPSGNCTAGDTTEFSGPYNNQDTVTICGPDDCEYNGSMDFAITATNTAWYEATATGQDCTETSDDFVPASQNPNQPPTPDAEPSNGCLQDADGEVWCTDDQTTSPPIPDNGTPGVPATPDGVDRDPDTGTTNNFFDNSTTNNSTNFTGGGTTSTTDGPSDGTPGSSFGGIDTDGDGEGDCDPSTEDCGTSQVSGGLTCNQPPTCNGDPIFCAIRFQAWNTRCNLEDDTTDITETDVMAQLGQTQTIEEYFDPANNPDNTIDVQAELTLDSPTIGSCPADLTANAGKFGTITIPSDILCDVATYINPIFIALAYLISGLMIHNSIVREM